MREAPVDTTITSLQNGISANTAAVPITSTTTPALGSSAGCDRLRWRRAPGYPLCKDGSEVRPCQSQSKVLVSREVSNKDSFKEVAVVVRVGVRSAARRGMELWTTPLKPAVDVLHVQIHGADGDYNHYRTERKHSTPDRAVSLVTTEALASLWKAGYCIRPGDFGENITLEAREVLLKAGVRLRAAVSAGSDETNEAPALELELTEPMTPCPNLEHIPNVAVLSDRQCRAFPRACHGRRGWYARVVVPGEISVGSTLEFVTAPESVATTSPRKAESPDKVQVASEEQPHRWRRRWGGGHSP